MFPKIEMAMQYILALYVGFIAGALTRCATDLRSVVKRSWYILIEWIINSIEMMSKHVPMNGAYNISVGVSGAVFIYIVEWKNAQNDG